MSINDLKIKKHPNDIDFIHEHKKKDENFY